MRLYVSQQMKMDQRMVLAPRMIQSMEILQLPLLALQERIEQELLSNPVLEQEEPVAEAEVEHCAQRLRHDAPTPASRMQIIANLHGPKGSVEIITPTRADHLILVIPQADGPPNPQHFSKQAGACLHQLFRLLQGLQRFQNIVPRHHLLREDIEHGLCIRAAKLPQH